MAADLVLLGLAAASAVLGGGPTGLQCGVSVCRSSTCPASCVTASRENRSVQARGSLPVTHSEMKSVLPGILLNLSQTSGTQGVEVPEKN